MARLFSDEDFPLPVVSCLRHMGHDVVTMPGRKLANKRVPDPNVLATATKDGRAVLTRNRWDYIRLHRASNAHAGIIACTHDPDSLALAARIHAAILPLADLGGLLIRVTRPSRPNPPLPAGS